MVIIDTIMTVICLAFLLIGLPSIAYYLSSVTKDLNKIEEQIEKRRKQVMR